VGRTCPRTSFAKHSPIDREKRSVLLVREIGQPRAYAEQNDERDAKLAQEYDP
jgi:hypothetical protein